VKTFIYEYRKVSGADLSAVIQAFINRGFSLVHTYPLVVMGEPPKVQGAEVDPRTFTYHSLHVVIFSREGSVRDPQPGQSEMAEWIRQDASGL